MLNKRENINQWPYEGDSGMSAQFRNLDEKSRNTGQNAQKNITGINLNVFLQFDKNRALLWLENVILIECISVNFRLFMLVLLRLLLRAKNPLDFLGKFAQFQNLIQSFIKWRLSIKFSINNLIQPLHKSPNILLLGDFTINHKFLILSVCLSGRL